MPWSKEEEKSYGYQQKIRRYMIDCVECECPITQKEHDENEGMCTYCYEEKVKKRG